MREAIFFFFLSLSFVLWDPILCCVFLFLSFKRNITRAQMRRVWGRVVVVLRCIYLYIKREKERERERKKLDVDDVCLGERDLLV